MVTASTVSAASLWLLLLVIYIQMFIWILFADTNRLLINISNAPSYNFTESFFINPPEVEHVWNVMAHAQKPDLIFQRNGRVHLNWRGGGGQFSRLLAAVGCASAVVMLDTPCSEVECKTTGYTLHSNVSPSLPLPCITVCHQVSTELYLAFGKEG